MAASEAIFVESKEVFDAIRERVWKGMAELNFDGEEDGRPVAVVIPLKRSTKPKRPKTETQGTMLVREKLTPEY